MPRNVVDAEVLRRDPAVVRDELKLGVLTLQRLVAAKVFADLPTWFPLVRPRGYGVTSLFAAVVLFLSAGPVCGIRPFLERLDRRTRSRLGALVGVRSLPTSASMSRALSRFDPEAVRRFVSSLLAASVHRDLLTHRAVLHHDAFGASWHVVDIDPTVDAIRRRDLPEGEELPPGQRRARGEPGYVGRKRGEARMRLVPVMHDGAGLWLAMRLVAEEGSIVPHCRALLQSTMQVLREHSHKPVIVRGDGEFGSVGALRAILDAGAHPLVRLSRYQLLTREDVRAHLRQVDWYPVPRGESGLERQAAELGTFTLHSAEGAAEPATVEVRVFVTRFRRTSAPEHGVVCGDYQLELFATTLAPEAWPATDLAALYGGRAVVENRLAQTDREFDLKRTFSFVPAGQEWMCGVGLFLWNEQVRAGWWADPPPEAVPVQPPRPALETLRRPPLNWPDAPPPDAAPPTLSSEGSVAEVPAPEVGEPPLPAVLQATRAALGAIVARVYADVSAWPGWSIEAEKAQLRCPENRRLFAFTATGPSPSCGPRLGVRTEPHACDGCPIRATCFTGQGPYKQLVRVLREDELPQVLAALSALRAATRPRPRQVPRRRARPVVADRSVSSTSSGLHAPFRPPEPVLPGPLYAAAPRFLPARARRKLREEAAEVTIVLRVSVPKTRRAAPAHPLLAIDAADRAHRRQTRQQAHAAERSERRLRLLTSTCPGSPAKSRSVRE
jgi:hypothetical protein